MKFLFITYRWGDDLVGGAEIHHRRLAEELVDLGHQVEVLTTTGHELRAFCHWGNLWEERGAPGREEGRIPVTRVKLKRRSKWQLAAAAKALQWKMEREEQSIPDALLDTLLKAWPATEGVHLLNGWHYPEMQDGKPVRWTQPRARLAARTEAPSRIAIKGHAPRNNHARLLHNGNVLAEKRVTTGWFEIETTLPANFNGIITLEFARAWRPVKDFRALTLFVQSVEFQPEGGELQLVDLLPEYRSLGRAVPEAWQDFLLKRALERHRATDRFIGFLRGPQAAITPELIAGFGADHVIHCNLPWANVELVRDGDLAMPIWHIEDEFFYWRPWIEALKRARFVLANTPYTEQGFFPQLGIRAHFVGPPIWEPRVTVTAQQRLATRERLGAAKDEVLVLTVCRKSPEKGYEHVARAVEKLHRDGDRIRMAGVGPDIDGRPFNFDGCQWAGRMLGEELQQAYAACDVFCLMSESESFGMVIPEAWHHGKPVVVNRLCGPAASLVQEEKDGLLAAPGAELEAALRTLASDGDLRNRLGREGAVKAQQHYTRGAAAKRLLAALG